ncbi:Two-component system yycFG regulatory protein [Alloiococcus otitis]|uniref:Regulatory protein YycH-like domain-containing protein n=1 Tax=Alloiococcus otitis ATCC 51267 TaxID=883081 RepID=K9EAS2_9LACT|nr:two-component system regulatory protein YycI [Alloiococcus otitis]EKU93788.1 hypothetical protein HMPREF9698_00736 [Alloiococcus otitis ATCC 51267]SUU80216.1 Two-component system yycFG regulatory protein [Alloiococcus otitis]
MDFKKIETIFIIAFAILNLYLFNSYTNRTSLHYATSFDDSVNIVERMDQSDINLPNFEEVEHEVKAVQADDHDLLEEEAIDLEDQAGSVSSDGSYYTSFLSNPLELDGNPNDGFTDSDYMAIEEFVKSDYVLFGQEYSFGEFDPETSRFIYYQTVNGLPVMDGTSQISLFIDSNNDIFSYHQLYAGPMTDQGEEEETITDLEAVQILFQNNDIPPGSTVDLPILSYHRTLDLEDLSIYTPVWVVRVSTSSGKQSFRVHALNGTIIQNPAVFPLEEEEEDQESGDDEGDQDFEEADGEDDGPDQDPTEDDDEGQNDQDQNAEEQMND